MLDEAADISALLAEKYFILLLKRNRYMLTLYTKTQIEASVKLVEKQTDHTYTHTPRLNTVWEECSTCLYYTQRQSWRWQGRDLHDCKAGLCDTWAPQQINVFMSRPVGEKKSWMRVKLHVTAGLTEHKLINSFSSPALLA